MKKLPYKYIPLFMVSALVAFAGDTGNGDDGARAAIGGQVAPPEYTWENANIQGMGYVSGIAVHPLTGEIYIRLDVGGVMRWDGPAGKWIPITDGKISTYNVEAIALNPGNANEVFIVTGNKTAGKMYKSPDKGETWQVVSRDFKPYVAGNSDWRNNAPRLAIDPNNGGRVMFYGSIKDGLWKSENSGVNWERVPSSVIPAGAAQRGGQAFVVFDAETGGSDIGSATVYVGVAGEGIFRSTNGGGAFTKMNGGPDDAVYTPVAGAMSSTGALYVTYCKKWNDGDSGKIYKFEANGTGTDITPANNNGLSFGPVDVCDKDPNKVVTFQWRFGEKNGIHYSVDGGHTWEAKTCSFANMTTPSWWDKNGAINWDYCGGIAFDPEDSRKVWFTTGHGVFTAKDITVEHPVYEAKMHGLEELVILQFVVPPSPNTTAVLVALADQRGFSLLDLDHVPEESWSAGKFGMTSSIDYCVANPNFVARVSDSQHWTKPTGYGKFSVDGGRTWSLFTGKPEGAASGNIAISASNPAVMVWAPINSAYNSLNVPPHYTEDGGATWNKSGGLPDGNNFCSQQWSQSKFLVSDRVNGDVFYYYSWDEKAPRFYRSVDGGKNFSLVSTAILPGSWKIKLEVVPGKEGHLMFCAAEGSDLYYSEDGGDTWRTIANVSKCAKFGFGKPVGGSLYPSLFIKATVGGVDGIFFSSDKGGTWHQIYGGNIPAGLTDISGDMDEEYTVYFGTSGRGLFYGKAIH